MQDWGRRGRKQWDFHTMAPNSDHHFFPRHQPFRTMRVEWVTCACKWSAAAQMPFAFLPSGL